MSNITIFEEEFDNVTGFKMPDTGGNTVTYTEGGGGSPTLETVTKTYTPTASQQTETITPSSGFDGIGEVDVTVDAMPTGSYGTATWSKAIQQNKLFVSPSFANFDDGYFANAPNIAASLDLETKSVTPSETAQTVTPTSLNQYLYSVSVGAIPSDYVGSGITQRSSSDLSASGATVTAPAGYYGSAATKTIASGSATTPATTIDAEPVIDFDPDTGEMSVALNKTQSITPTVSAGYVSSGTAGNVTVTGSDSFTLDVKGASTYYPSASDQTIAGDQWLSGNQTIKAVTTTNLTAANIKSGVVVEVGDSADSDRVLSVTGTYTGGGGSSTTLNANGQYIVASEETVTADTGYNGKITVSKTPILTHNWDFTTSLTDTVSGVTATLYNGATRDSTGLTIAGSTQYCSLGVKYAAYKTYEIDVTSFSKSFSSGHGRFFMAANGEGFILQNGSTWNCYLSGAWCGSGGTNKTYFDGKTIRICTNEVHTSLMNGTSSTRSFWHIYVNGTIWYKSLFPEANQSSTNLMIGSAGGASLCTLIVTGVRIYDGANYT